MKGMSVEDTIIVLNTMLSESHLLYRTEREAIEAAVNYLEGIEDSIEEND